MLTNFTDDLRADIERINEMDCLKTANESAAVRTIDAKTEDLARNWHPTGFYTPAEVRSIVAEVLGAHASARMALATAPMSTSDAASMVRQANKYLDRNEERSKAYLDAAIKAQNNGIDAIDAPGLKTWVLNSMVNISHAYTTVAALSCRTTWLDVAANLVIGIWNTAKRIAGVVIKAGDTILNAAEDVWGIYPYLKWGVIGLALTFGGIFAWGRVRDFHARSIGE